MASIVTNIKDGKIVSFKFKVCLGRDEKGKQIFKCKTWNTDRTLSANRLRQLAEKEAAIWESEVIEQHKREQTLFKSSDTPFDDFVNHVWIPSRLTLNNCRPSTVEFRTYLLKVILPYFGNMPINSITSKHITQFMDYLQNTYKTKDNRSLSAQTLKHYYCTLNLIFDFAVEQGHIEVNPLGKVETPKLPRHKVNALSKSEVSVFISELEKLPHFHKAIYVLMITTGLRRGECFGLQWKDIDFESATASIERNAVYTTKSGTVIGKPKTDNGIRIVPLAKYTVEALKEYKSSLLSVGDICGDMYVFPSDVSPYIPHDPTYITKHLKKFMKKAGLPDMSPHDLRHTCASVLLQSGADIKSVQDILGHADASTTLNFYVKSDIECMRGATDKAFSF